MTGKSRLLLMAMAMMTITTTAQAAGYFVRPVLQYEGSFIDGYAPNGATTGSLSFSDSFQSFNTEVDLAQGTIKTFLEMNGPNDRFGIVSGVMGERIRYTGETGTAVNFSFDFDGTINAEQFVLGEGEPMGGRQILIQAFFAVYDASVGATYLNWSVGGTNSPLALISQFESLSFSSTDQNYYETVFNNNLGGSLNLESGKSYDVFAAFNLLAKPGSDPGRVTMNFLNTGTIGISDSNFTSSSGQFLGFAQTAGGVPEPSQWAMLVIGFGVIGTIARRRPKTVTA